MAKSNRSRAIPPDEPAKPAKERKTVSPQESDELQKQGWKVISVNKIGADKKVHVLEAP